MATPAPAFPGTNEHVVSDHPTSLDVDHPLNPTTIDRRTAHLPHPGPRCLPAGAGHLHLSTTISKDGQQGKARFSTSIASYPLKLLAPSPLASQPNSLAIVYTLAYGGGLVAADIISLRVHVERGGGLVMLTQGSTKVFRKRPGLRPLSYVSQALTRPHSSGTHPQGLHGLHDLQTAVRGAETDLTKQRMHVTLDPDAYLLLLPDSISPFKESKYLQSQRFVLPADGSASVVVVDWVNSGRGHRPPHGISAIKSGDGDREIWSMESYTSTNEVLVGDRLVMREKMVLENNAPAAGSMTPVARRLAPYNAYATMMVYGPRMKSLLAHLREMCDETQQFQINKPPDLTWSYSDVDGEIGGIARIAGKRIEHVRDWMRDVLREGGVKDLVGEGVWPRII